MRRRRRRHRRRPAGATRPARAASATSSAGSSTPGARARTPTRRRRRASRVHEHLTELAAAQPVGEHGLVALDWHSGNRSVLVDHELSGVVVGQTLATRPEDVYRALLEATAFGTRTIVEAFGDSGVPVDGVRRRRRAGQERAAHADLRRRDPAAALGDRLASRARRSGSAIHAAVAAGAYPDVPTAAAAMGKVAARRLPARRGRGRGLRPSCTREYLALHDHFGRGGNDVMHRLKAHPPRGRRAARTVTSDDRRRPTSRRRSPRCARGRARCTPSWSATGSWSGRRATSRRGCPAHDLLVIKPSGVSYDELTPENMVVCDLDGERRRGRARAVVRHRRARLRLPAHARGRRRRAHPLDVRHRVGGARRGRSRACSR